MQYFFGHLGKHLDLVRRRLIDGETIPHEEKVFSLFEPYTEWIKKGKAGNQPELGLPICVAKDQYGFILSHRVMQKEHDEAVAVPMAEMLVKKYPINSLSFDKNFSSARNQSAVRALVPTLVLPKKGKRNQEKDEREHTKAFKRLRRQHASVESTINALEHHGLNRCPDRGIEHFKNYTAVGVLALNLHQLGNILLDRDRQAISKNRIDRKTA